MLPTLKFSSGLRMLVLAAYRATKTKKGKNPRMYERYGFLVASPRRSSLRWPFDLERGLIDTSSKPRPQGYDFFGTLLSRVEIGYTLTTPMFNTGDKIKVTRLEPTEYTHRYFEETDDVPFTQMH